MLMHFKKSTDMLDKGNEVLRKKPKRQICMFNKYSFHFFKQDFNSRVCDYLIKVYLIAQ